MRKFILYIFFIFIINESMAHGVMLSLYKLKYEDNQWYLYVSQKTKPLMKEVQIDREDLKNKSLNSPEFLKATSQYLITQFKILKEESVFDLTPVWQEYGGLKFKGKFLVKGLNDTFDLLTFKTNGYKSHEQSTSVLTIFKGELGKVFYFSQQENITNYSFRTHEFLEYEILEKKGIWECVLSFFGIE